MNPEKIHLIAIGGSVMHNLALELHRLGHSVTGSDDEIYDPAKSRLEEKGLLPAQQGWFPEKISAELDWVILGMHAKEENPELNRARELGLKIRSFPEFLYEHSRDKQRIVIAGSHGKTTITSMIMYVLRQTGRKFDYMVGAQVEGFDNMVGLSNDSPAIVLEGDEYLASPMDPRPKFLLYQPHMALISGIAWDHINVFPTEKIYRQQFVRLIDAIPKAGVIIYNEEDKGVKSLVKKHAKKEEQYILSYKAPSYKYRNGEYEIKLGGSKTPVKVIGRHNLSNIAGAWEVCRQLAVRPDEFLYHISQFRGAAGRLEKVYEDENNIIFKDYAHSPSKVKATVSAIKEQFGKRNIIACLELHTFSSLNKAFLDQYKKTLAAIRKKVVFVNQHTLKMKNFPAISRKELTTAFDDKNLEYATTLEELTTMIRKMKDSKNVLLMMSSGNFGGLDLKSLGNE